MIICNRERERERERFDEKVGMQSKVTEREVRLERRGQLIIGVGAGSSRTRVTGEVG